MPFTTLNARVVLKKATRIVDMLDHHGHLPRIHQNIGTINTAIADDATVTATRVDQAGSASGTVLNDDRGNVYATFAGALAAGIWDLSV